MTKLKYLVVTLFFFSFTKIYALDTIKIDNQNLIPIFDINTSVYNYYTSKDTIKIEVSKSSEEIVKGYGVYKLKEGLNEFEVESKINDEIKTYHINVYKNYTKEDESIATFKYFEIEGYDIDFKNDVFDYYVNIEDETHLNFNYELDNYESLVNIENNGNFESGNNDIKVTITSKNKANSNTYVIHVQKAKQVFKETKKTKELSFIQKQVLIILIVTVCSALVVLTYYLIFIKKIF